jgi:hypothetical protein
MSTTIEIMFGIVNGNDLSGIEMSYGEPHLRAKSLAIVTAATNAIASVERSVPLQFSDNQDPRYIEALNALASALHTKIAGLIATEIDQHLPCPGEALRAAAPGLFGGPRAATNPKYEIRFGDDGKCKVCGKDCHTCDGILYSSCPAGAAYSPVLWVDRSRGKVVTFKVGLNIRFLRESH